MPILSRHVKLNWKLKKKQWYWMVLWTHNMSRPTFPRFFPSTKYSYWTLLQSEVKTLIQIQNNNTTWLKTIIFRHCARKFVIFWTSPNLKLDLYCAGLVLVEFDQSGTNAAATNTSICTNLDFSPYTYMCSCHWLNQSVSHWHFLILQWLQLQLLQSLQWLQWLQRL